MPLNQLPLDGSGEGTRDRPRGVGATEGGMGRGYVFTIKPAMKGSIEVAPFVCSAERASLNRPTITAQKYRLLMKMKNNLSNSTLSSNFYDGKGDRLFLSNGERPNPFPEHKLLNGYEVELNLFGTIYPIPHFLQTFMMEKGTDFSYQMENDPTPFRNISC